MIHLVVFLLLFFSSCQQKKHMPLKTTNDTSATALTKNETLKTNDISIVNNTLPEKDESPVLNDKCQQQSVELTFYLGVTGSRLIATCPLDNKKSQNFKLDQNLPEGFEIKTRQTKDQVQFVVSGKSFELWDLKNSLNFERNDKKYSFPFKILIKKIKDKRFCDSNDEILLNTTNTSLVHFNLSLCEQNNKEIIKTSIYPDLPEGTLLKKHIINSKRVLFSIEGIFNTTQKYIVVIQKNNNIESVEFFVNNSSENKTVKEETVKENFSTEIILNTDKDITLNVNGKSFFEQTVPIKLNDNPTLIQAFDIQGNMFYERLLPSAKDWDSNGNNIINISNSDESNKHDYARLNRHMLPRLNLIKIGDENSFSKKQKSVQEMETNLRISILDNEVKELKRLNLNLQKRVSNEY